MNRKRRVPIRALVFLICAVAVLALIVVTAVTLFSRSRRGGVTVRYKELYGISQTDRGTLLIMPWKGKEPCEIDLPADYSYSTYFNADRSFFAIRTHDTGSLYRIGGGEAQFIDDDVNRVFTAVTGDAAAYSDGFSGQSEVSGLYVLKGDSGERISTGFTGEATFSPDGKHLLFTEVADDGYTLKLYDGKSLTDIITIEGRSLIPVAVSNGAERIFYCAQGSRDKIWLYCHDGKKETEVAQFSSEHSVFRNIRHDEVIFSDGSNYRICADGKKSVRLRENSLAPLTSYGMVYLSETSGRFNRHTITYDTFRGTLFRGGNTVYRFGKDFEPESIVKRVSLAAVSTDNRTLVYLHAKGGLYRMDANKPGAEAFEITDENVLRFLISADGDAVFYVEEDGRLYDQRGKKEPVRISGRKGLDEVYGSYHVSCAYDEASKTLFYIEDGTVYASVGGKEGTEVTDVDGDAYMVSSNMLGTSVFTHGRKTDSLYRSTNGKTFTLMTDEIIQWEE